MVMPTWISEVQAFGPAFIGVGVVAISIQQLRVSARKLKLDLYQRRYEVFTALHAYMIASWNFDVNSKKNYDKEVSERRTTALNKLDVARAKAYEKMAESRFLFDDETCAYISCMLKKSAIFSTSGICFSRKKMAEAPEEVKNLADKNMERTMWMMNQYEPLVAAFSPSMKLDYVFGLHPWSRILSRVGLAAKL